MRPAAVVLLAVLLAGCSDEAGSEDGQPVHPWLAGDRWTYRLELPGGAAADAWVVVGPATLGGEEVIQVRSTTTRPQGTSSEVGSFDAETLALRRIDGAGVALDFDPVEVWLLPAAARTYRTNVTETRAGDVRTAEVDYTVTPDGEDVVETDAGAFSAERFTVRKSTSTATGSREETSTWWWSPVVANVVRQDVEGATFRTLASYALVDGPRTVPG